ncbi:MAG: hypothetical protein M3O36_18615 [Myxococcota bacterium]|nr:hypothetical protein [Myxococcota bacterium]
MTRCRRSLATWLACSLTALACGTSPNAPDSGSGGVDSGERGGPGMGSSGGAVSSGASAGAPSGGGGGSNGGSFIAGAGNGGLPTDGGGPGATDAFVGCATTTEKATQLPLDLVFMIDSSGSMNDLIAAGRSKWSAVVSAMSAFLSDPASAGIGVGLQYFPLTAAGVPATCTSSAQCNASGPCLLRICSNSAAVVACDVDADCLGAPCIAVGECALDKNVLCQPGTQCGTDANGFPLGACQALTASSCAAGDSCATQDYATPAVPIATLPGVAARISASLSMHHPNGNTPTSPALQGAIAEARAHALANAGHTVVAVLATDGIPDECVPSDVPGIAALASAGASAMPAVKTFAIGVFTPDAIATGTADLDQIAAAGGTHAAFVINTNQNVEQQFASALAAIRGASLPCEYGLPTPSGGVPDFHKLNVQHTSADGSSSTLPYVESPAACGPTSGGWYYDVDPAEGGTPTKILVCPASCGTLKLDVTGRIDVVLGCATVLK